MQTLVFMYMHKAVSNLHTEALLAVERSTRKLAMSSCFYIKKNSSPTYQIELLSARVRKEMSCVKKQAMSRSFI